MFKMKILTTFLAIIFSIATLKGQDNMIINLVGNSDVTIAINDVRRITFDANNMLLKTVNGVETAYLLDNITSITFLDETGIDEQFTETIDVKIFVNSSGEIVVVTPHQIHKLTVFDLTGKEMATSSQSKLNVNFLNSEMYILQITTDKGLISKKFIKNR